MNYLRIVLVPFHQTILMMISVFSVVLTICAGGGLLGLFGMWFVCSWLLKYCYSMVDQLADGATEPPVMSVEMLSAFEARPVFHASVIALGIWATNLLGGTPAIFLSVVLLSLLPASIAVLGLGQPYYQALNPVLLFRVIRGLGVYYAMLFALLALEAGALWLSSWLHMWSIVWFALAQLLLISLFGFIGVALYERRREVGFEASRSPERAAERAEAERLRERARMLDEVFQLARIGRHIDATQPLANWFAAHPARVAEDALIAADSAVEWGNNAALEALGSTLIRHLLRVGRADAALTIYDKLCKQVPALTLDTRADLMALAEYAQSAGRARHAETLRDSARGMRFWSGA